MVLMCYLNLWFRLHYHDCCAPGGESEVRTRDAVVRTWKEQQAENELSLIMSKHGWQISTMYTGEDLRKLVIDCGRHGAKEFSGFIRALIVEICGAVEKKHAEMFCIFITHLKAKSRNKFSKNNILIQLNLSNRF